MKNIRIVLLSIGGLVLMMMGLNGSLWRKKAAREKAKLEKLKHETKVKSAEKILNDTVKVLRREEKKKKENKQIIKKLKAQQGIIEIELQHRKKKLQAPKEKFEALDKALKFAKDL